MKKRTLVLLAAMAAMTSVAPSLNAAMGLNCTEAENFDNSKVNMCVTQEEGVMNDTLKRLAKTYTHASWAAIEKSQQVWANYKAANCKFHKMNAGGGGADARALQLCIVRLTFDRNRELEHMHMSQ